MISQSELFDRASDDEKRIAESHLRRYRRRMDIIAEFEKMDKLSPKQQRAYDEYTDINPRIDRAVRLIGDKEVKRAIQIRFIEGKRRFELLQQFPLYVASTIDKRIKRGIKYVADNLKIFE